MKLAISLALGTAAIFVGSANAAPLMPAFVAAENGIENVRMVCDQYNRCWNDRSRRRIVIQQGYYEQPRPYYQRRGYYQSGPSVTLGFGGSGYGYGNRGW